MDHTILRINSGISLMRFLHRHGDLSSWRMLQTLYWGALYKVALLDIEPVAHRLAAGLMGVREGDLLARSRLWYDVDVVRHVVPGAVAAIESHRRRGDMVVMLTGAAQYVAEEVSRDLDIEHTLCSRLEVMNGELTGRWSQLCFGSYKVRVAERFSEVFGIDLGQSVFYSDSYHDLPMLRRVGLPVAINPDIRLRRHARRVGWPISRW